MGHMNSIVVVLVTVVALGHCSREIVSRWNFAIFKQKQKQNKQTKQQQNKEQFFFFFFFFNESKLLLHNILSCQFN